MFELFSSTVRDEIVMMIMIMLAEVVVVNKDVKAATARKGKKFYRNKGTLFLRRCCGGCCGVFQKKDIQVVRVACLWFYEHILDARLL